MPEYFVSGGIKWAEGRHEDAARRRNRPMQEKGPMERSMKLAWQPVLTVLMLLLTTCFISPCSFAQTSPGDDLFKSKCAWCHGPDGAGKTGMGRALKMCDLGSADVQKQADSDLYRMIAKGKNKMPAFDGKLKKEQIAHLVKYVRELGKK